MKKITFPALSDLRYRKVGDTFYVVGAPDAVSTAVDAGGAWIMTGRGPRVILVDGCVKVDGSVGIRVQETPEFIHVSKPTAPAVEDMSTEQLEALLKARKAAAGGTVTSNGRTRSTTSRTSRSTSKPADTVPAVSADVKAAASSAVEDISDADLEAALNS